MYNRGWRTRCTSRGYGSLSLVQCGAGLSAVCRHLHADFPQNPTRTRRGLLSRSPSSSRFSLSRISDGRCVAGTSLLYSRRVAACCKRAACALKFPSIHSWCVQLAPFVRKKADTYYSWRHLLHPYHEVLQDREVVDYCFKAPVDPPKVVQMQPPEWGRPQR